MRTHHVPSIYEFEQIRSAILKYKELNGDFLVDHSFAVPMESSDWPVETWGIELGWIISDILCNPSYKDYREKLFNLWFGLEDDSNLMGKSDDSAASVLASLSFASDTSDTKNTSVSQKTSSASLYAPTSLSSSSESLSSSAIFTDLILEAPDMTLYKRRNKENAEGNDNKRAKKSISRKIESNDKYYSTALEDYGSDQIRLALSKYKEINGNLFVERSFIIPFISLWPKEMWGIHLGKIVACFNNRTSKFRKRRGELLSLGLVTKTKRIDIHRERQKDLLSLGLITESKQNTTVLC